MKPNHLSLISHVRSDHSPTCRISTPKVSCKNGAKSITCPFPSTPPSSSNVLHVCSALHWNSGLISLASWWFLATKHLEKSKPNNRLPKKHGNKWQIRHGGTRCCKKRFCTAKTCSCLGISEIHSIVSTQFRISLVCPIENKSL